MKNEIKRVGLYLNAADWYFFRFGVSLLLAVLTVMMVQIIIYGFPLLIGVNLNHLSAWWFWILVTLNFTYVYARGEDSTGFSVPGKNFLAVLTWLGMPLPVYLETGAYTWSGKRLGFGRLTAVKADFTTPLEGKENSTANVAGDGFLIGGPNTFKVWNSADSKEKDRTIIKAPTKNRADIRASLTLILEVVDPLKLLDSDDPALDIGDRARQEIRELFNLFVDTDVPNLQSVTAEVLMGTRLVTVFLPQPKGNQAHKLGAMIRTVGGDAIFTVLRSQPDTEEFKNEVAAFTKRIMDEADADQLKLVSKQNSQGQVEIKLDWVVVSKPLSEVLSALGLRLQRATFGDIILSDEVTKAANAASAEADQRIAELADARTKAAARKVMLPGEEELQNPAWETAMILAEAKGQGPNGTIRVVFTPGADSLTRAAVAGASQIGSK